MPAPVYSTKFLEGHQASGLFQVTVPEGYIMIIRDVDVGWLEGVTGAQFSLLGAQGQSLWIATWHGLAEEDSSSQSWRGRQVMNPGDQWGALCNGALDYAISGYLLTV